MGVDLLAQKRSHFMVRENGRWRRVVGRVRAPKLISCRSQTQPQVRDNNVCVFGCVCLREEEKGK